MKALEKLYRALNDDLVKDNVFETEEIHEVYNKFEKKYLDPAYASDYHAGQDMTDCFNTALSAERESAFMIGFKTALELMHESLK